MCYRHADVIIECPVCGQANELARMTCVSCGAELPDIECTDDDCDDDEE